MRTTFFTFAAAALMLANGICAHAQIPFNYTPQQTENQRLLNRYLWSSKVEVRVKSKVWAVASFQARYDQDGKVVLTQVGGGSLDPASGVVFTQRNQREIDKDKLNPLIVEITGQLRAYQNMTPDQVQAALKGASRQAGTGEMKDTDQLTAANVLKSGDRVTLWVDHNTGIQRRVVVESTAEAEKFTSTWTFARLPNGPWYVNQRVVEVPGKNLRMVTQNTSFWR